MIDALSQLFAYQFMQNAFLAGTTAAVLGGIVGYFVVLRGEAFAGHTLAIVGFPGAAGAILFGLPQLLGLAVLCTASGLGIGVLGRGAVRDRHAESAAIGTIQAFMLGLGFLFVTLYKGLLEGVYSILFGTFLGVTRAQVLLLLAIAVVALAALALIGRPLLYLSVDEPAAAAAGVPVRMLSIGFLVVLGLAIASTALITGALLVFALLVMPAAAANQLVARPGLAMLVSVGLGLVIVWSGLTISYFTDLPIGFLVTGVGFVIYAVARLARQLSGA
ncbi:MAG TPA: metal ABC transporter permease [Chloroflexi bacterium]|jgi:zinc/manganese transport system permease protein|nr:metal ABC transporter permease [Chloroflexota bacterium]HAF20949.1 metal ABC transporter permease [Chloroflexota bacterium]